VPHDGSLLHKLRLRWHELSPPAILALSFAVLIAEGTLGLMLLPGLHAGPPLQFVDALFTMTSAVCVTGLVVVDTATAFTRAGQLWILLHVQLGGVGLLTLTTLVIGAMGRALSLRSELLVGAPAGFTRQVRVASLAAAVARFTLAVELVGALALLPLLAPRFGLAEGAWHAAFHSVSAFCNAGFSTFSDSLVSYANSPPVLLIVSLLVVLGGLGFLSIEECARWWRNRRLVGRRRLSVHTYAALLSTAILLGAGTLLFGAFEWNGALASLGPVDRLVNAWFMSVTPRTAGFNSIPYGEVANSTGYLTILLMMIGGSPGSTAGGVKTTTLAVLVALTVTRIRGRTHVVLHDRTVPKETIERTVSLTLVAFAAVTAAVFLLSILETHTRTARAGRDDFLAIFFEVVSAFGTVGLTMDFTPTLTPGGKLLIIALMFLGRVGPLAFFAAISLRARAHVRAVRAAHEDVVVG
jgi:trk system potassium uptake protein TrkH